LEQEFLSLQLVVALEQDAPPQILQLVAQAVADTEMVHQTQVRQELQTKVLLEVMVHQPMVAQQVAVAVLVQLVRLAIALLLVI
jgi:hypothetical protein